MFLSFSCFSIQGSLDDNLYGIYFAEFMIMSVVHSVWKDGVRGAWWWARKVILFNKVRYHLCGSGEMFLDLEKLCLAGKNQNMLLYRETSHFFTPLHLGGGNVYI